MNHSTLRAACRLGIGVVIAALVVRTWLAMGIVVPVTVAGSSMAPTLLGPHRTFRCEVCGHEFAVGLDQLPTDDRAVCPYCRQRRAVSVEDLGGDQVVVDRAAFAWRPPRRWEVVVFRCPEMADQLCVKRVVGLPGETVTLVGGDIWIDGRRVRKTLVQQQAVRQLVHRLAADVAVPPAPDTRSSLGPFSPWQWTATRPPGGIRWLVYHQPGGGPITDDSSYNQRAPHRLHAMHDVMLSFQARLEGDGQLRLKALGNGGEWVVTCDAARRSVQLCRKSEKGSELFFNRTGKGDSPRAKNSSDPFLAPFSALWSEWTFSLFDRQVLLAIDGRVVMVAPDEVPNGVAGVDRHRREELVGVPPGSPGAHCARPQPPTDGPLAIGVAGLRGEIRDLAVWRDVYYESRPEDRPVPLAGATGGGWRLGPEQYFVLGDNAAVSDDSRSWLAGPGLDAKLVIGKPLGVR
jgi:signal peptidase I